MPRLIDADEFKKQIAGMAIANNYPPDKANKMCELIDRQPTAYDVDKVVERLEDKAIEELGIDKARFAMDRGEYSCCCSLCLSDAVEIVKSGGIE